MGTRAPCPAEGEGEAQEALTGSPAPDQRAARSRRAQGTQGSPGSEERTPTMHNNWDRPGAATCMDCGQGIGWVLTEDGFDYHPAYVLTDGRTRHPRVVCKDCSRAATAIQN